MNEWIGIPSEIFPIEVLQELEDLRTQLTVEEPVSGELSGPTEQETLEMERFLNIVEFLPDATFVIDDKKCIIAWNRAIEELTGIPREQVLGQGDYAYSKIFYGERRPALIDLLGQTDFRQYESKYKYVRQHETTLYSETFLPMLYEGKGGYVWATAAPLHDSEGQRIGAFESLRDISDRWRLEKEILRIQEREQRRIGQDLHDGLCQELKSIELMAAVLQRKLESRQAEEASSAADIAQMINEAISHTRNLARGLSPVQVETRGLMSALRELSAQIKSTTGIRCYFSTDQQIDVEDNAVATHLFRIAQEAVQNAVKHANASHILLDLFLVNDRVVLTIQDDGIGFNSKIDHDGMGLHSMSYRAHMIGAQLELNSNPGQGTRLVCWFPLSKCQ